MDIKNIGFKSDLYKFFQSYATLSKKDPSSWLVFNKDGTKHSVETNYACHARLRDVTVGVYDTLITAVPKSSKADLTFLNTLINGPFRSVSDLISLVLDPDAQLWYLELAELSRWPANLLFNFCIASRMPIEYPNEVAYGLKLITRGYDPTLAYLIAVSNGGKPLSTPTRSWVFNNHMWFDTSSDWWTILSGSPTKLADNFRDNPGQITPSNTIWGSSTDSRKLQHLTDEEIAVYFNMVPKAPPKTGGRIPRGQTFIIDFEAGAVGEHAWAEMPAWVNGLPVAVQVHQLINAGELGVWAQPPQFMPPPQPVDFDDDDDDDFPEFDDDDDDDFPEFDDDEDDDEDDD